MRWITPLARSTYERTALGKEGIFMRNLIYVHLVLIVIEFIVHIVLKMLK